MPASVETFFDEARNASQVLARQGHRRILPVRVRALAAMQRQSCKFRTTFAVSA
jgi:hypothetical protein